MKLCRSPQFDIGIPLRRQAAEQGKNLGAGSCPTGMDPTYAAAVAICGASSPETT